MLSEAEASGPDMKLTLQQAQQKQQIHEAFISEIHRFLHNIT